MIFPCLARRLDRDYLTTDRSIMELEQLSSKNAQLAEMNNDPPHQIQETYADGRVNLKALRISTRGNGKLRGSLASNNQSVSPHTFWSTSSMPLRP